MSAHKPPPRVWVCWCTACGRVDYAYDEEPKESSADCPGCEVDRSYKKIAGPYTFALAEDLSTAAPRLSDADLARRADEVALKLAEQYGHHAADVVKSARDAVRQLMGLAP